MVETLKESYTILLGQHIIVYTNHKISHMITLQQKEGYTGAYCWKNETLQLHIYKELIIMRQMT